MITDNLVLLAGTVSPTNLAITGQLVTALGNNTGTNTIDAGPLAGGQITDYGIGGNVDITISILQTLTSGGAATVKFQLVMADDAALTTNVQVVVSTDDIPFATLVAGSKATLHWDRAVPYAPKRYLGLRTVIGTAVLTNAVGWLVAMVGTDAHDIGTNGRGVVFKTGYGIA
jgi:hypothetical protein